MFTSFNIKFHNCLCKKKIEGYTLAMGKSLVSGTVLIIQIALSRKVLITREDELHIAHVL
jgi:hypothetical protein